MNRKKYIYFICGLILIAVVCIYFTFINYQDKESVNNKKIENNESESKLHKLADNLYETNFENDFDWENAKKTKFSSMSCSGIQNGQYRGRNYDWFYANTDISIVHVQKTNSRPHSSVGVSDLSFSLNDDDSVDYNNIPFTTVDGINDAGVVIQVNVMPSGENGKIIHTPSTDDDIWGGHVVRYILDNADSVNHAISLLKEKDIYTVLDEIEELHWMISGPTTKEDDTIKTVVVEVFPDGIHVTEDFIDNKPIMTNFNISNFDGTMDTVGLGQGYERWQILNENYDQANSVMGTFDLMEKVFYSKMYDLYGDRFWYSEYNGANISKFYDADTLKNILGEEKYNYYIDNYGAVYYTSLLWDGEKSLKGDISKAGILSPVVKYEADNYNKQNKENNSLWITVHTSIYDIKNKTLDIQVRESQDHLHFTIN